MATVAIGGDDITTVGNSNLRIKFLDGSGMNMAMSWILWTC